MKLSAPALALCLSLVVLGCADRTGSTAGKDIAGDVAYQLERPPAAAGQRGLLAVPAWVLWASGAAFGVLSAAALWRIAKNPERL